MMTVASGIILKMQNEQPIQHWFESRVGESILNREREWNSEALRSAYGMHLMQLGLPHTNLADHALEIHHRFVVSVGVRDSHSWAVLEGDEQALPIATESLSVVVLPHVLEFSGNPHQLLREVTRVLAEDGMLVIYGFSPWSIANFSRRLPRGHYLSPRHVIEWLGLLGYQLHQRRELPWFDWRWRRSGLYSGFYQLVARRQVAPLSPIRLQWRQRAAIATGNLVGRHQIER